MTVLNIAFTKIYAEKVHGAHGQVKVNTNVGVKSVEKSELELASVKQPTARFEFEFKVSYEPKIGEIGILGEVIWVDSKENILALLDNWKKSKKIDQKILLGILNRILAKSHIEALILSKELNLPAPVQLPKVTATK